jgi:hypothetical protein
MNSQDHAIVVGIGRYPRFAEHAPPAPQDLQGPENDAEAIHAWLTNPAGGDLDAANARLIRSSDFPDPFPSPDAAQPAEREIVEALTALKTRPRRADGKIGRRFYLYVSGHGFGRERNSGGLYTAPASPEILDHVFIASWFRWFVDAALFEQYVLWFDACVTRNRLANPKPVVFPIQNSADAHLGRVFVAYAARFPAKAVERRMPDGKIHGAFTYTLLLGLQGAAADPVTGDITTGRLKDYLIGTMSAHMLPEDIEDPDVSNEPDFGIVDELVIVSRSNAVGTVQLRLPAALLGKPLEIRDGTLASVASKPAESPISLSLAPGLYKAVSPQANWSRNFEVTGDGNAVIDLA